LISAVNTAGKWAAGAGAGAGVEAATHNGSPMEPVVGNYLFTQ